MGSTFLQDFSALGDALDWVFPGSGFVVLAVVLLLGVRRRRRRLRTVEHLLDLTPTQFEEAVASLLVGLGYRSVRRTGKPGDLTADIQCTDRKGRPVVVQCKRYARGNRVGSPDVQTFIGMATVHHRAELGIFVTTSAFTEPARKLASEYELILYDGEELNRLLGKVRVSRPSNQRRSAA